MNLSLKALKLFAWMVLVTGLIYPLFITVIAFITMPEKAAGSFTMNSSSLLIGQAFESEKYFWPRPSAVNYNPLPSGGSNWGPTSAQLKQAVDERRRNIAALQDMTQPIPSELLFASGSGLDPHISPETAYFQMKRVADSRKLGEQDRKKLQELIHSFVEKRSFGFLGMPRVNVLKLNLALDAISESHPPENI